jgi:hypothetical protein
MGHANSPAATHGPINVDDKRDPYSTPNSRPTRRGVHMIAVCHAALTRSSPLGGRQRLRSDTQQIQTYCSRERSSSSADQHAQDDEPDDDHYDCPLSPSRSAISRRGLHHVQNATNTRDYAAVYDISRPGDAATEWPNGFTTAIVCGCRCGATRWNLLRAKRRWGCLWAAA